MDFFDDFEDEAFFDDNLEIDDALSDESDREGEPEDAESQDNDFTAKDAFFIGGAKGFAYEEGLRRRKRKKQKRFSDDYD